ncbi:MAG: ABC transporter ATP-binding protein [Bacteroidales bacterium]|jgi:putative ABC transport system ATP-binding protein|nr:ABC transporter ATP-binding protein [Bacteroidales bacterium]
MIKLNQIHKTYTTQFTELHVLKGVNIHIKCGEMVAIMGSSGSGKSTLMNIIGLLDKYDNGDYYLNGKQTKELNKVEMASYRNRFIGFVFQNANLIAYKNIVENVALPLYYRNIKRKKRNSEAMDILQNLGLLNHAKHFPNELSGGQKQRVAIARALVANPKIILADEPTGQLDTATSNDIIKIIRSINEQGTTVIIVTHEHSVARQADRIVFMKDGIIE